MLRLWDVAAGRCLRTFEGYEKVVGAVAFSPDGRYALSGSFDQESSEEVWKLSGKLRLWDVSLLMDGRTVSPWLYSIAITAEEALERERTHNSHLSRARQALEGGHIGEALASLTLARAVRGFERSHESLELHARVGARCRIKSYGGGWMKRSFEGHKWKLECVAFSRDGRFALSGSSESLRLWDMATGQCLRAVEINANVWTGSMAFSSDCRFALSGSDALMVGEKVGEKETSLELQLWDVATGKCLRTFHGNEPVAISPDGRFALCGRGEKVGEEKVGEEKRSYIRNSRFLLWDLDTGQCLHTFEEDKFSIVKTLTFSPDGRFVLSGDSVHNKLRLWDIATRQCLRTFEGHKQNTKAVAFSPDGHFALSGAEDNTLRLWDVAGGQCLRTFEGHKQNIAAVAFSPDGHFALSGAEDNTLRLWDVTTGQCLRTFEAHTEWVKSVAFSPDGRYVLSGGGDNKVRLWEIDWEYEYDPKHDPVLTGKPAAITAEEALEREHNSHLSRALQAFEAGHIGEALAALTLARAVRGFERSRKSLQLQARVGARCRIKSYGGGWQNRSFEYKSSLKCVSFSGDGRFALCGGSGEVRVWDVSTGQCLRTLKVGEKEISLEWDVAPGKCLPTIQRNDPMAISPDGRYVLSGGGDNKVRLWDVTTGQCLRTFEGHTDWVKSVVFSPDGHFALSGAEDNTLRLWDVAGGQCLRTFEENKFVETLTFSPDGRYVLSGGGDNKVRLWDVTTGQCLRTFEGHTDCVKSVVFSPDGRFALSASDDKTVRLWDVVTKQCLRTFEGHTEWVECVAFSPDGRFALSGSDDETVRLWDVTTGQCLRTFEGHTEWVKSVAFSPDGRYVLSGGDDNVRLWEIDWEYEYDPKHDPVLTLKPLGVS